jgi:hypothetical protein
VKNTCKAIEQVTILRFVINNYNWLLLACAFNISLNSINQLIFVMVKCVVLFGVRTGFFTFRQVSSSKG